MSNVIAPAVQSVQYGPLDYALGFASIGIPVFPTSPIKTPFSNADVAAAIGMAEPARGDGGLKFATTNPDHIRAWWSRWPAARIGIRTGSVSSLYVLDIDRKDGKDGFATLAAKGWTLPTSTVCETTGSGGMHCYFRIPTDGSQAYKSDAGILGSGLDRRGDKGFVVWCGADFRGPMEPPPAWMLSSGGASAPGSTNDQRKPLGSDPAPSFTHATKALTSIDPNALNYDDWRNLSASFRQSATGHGVEEASVRIIWDGWCAGSSSNDQRNNDKLWRSLDAGTNLGWSYLRSETPPAVKAELTFGQPIDGEIMSNDMFSEPLFGKLAGSAVSTELVAHIKDANLPIGFDLLKQRQIKLAAMPWDKPNGRYPAPWIDDDDVYLTAWFHRYQLKPSAETIRHAVLIAAHRHEVNPLVDYLNGLQWDQNRRIDDLFVNYFHASNPEFARIIGAKFLIGMVARAFEPGCKRDEMLVLEGPQGILKSTALNVLAGDDYFSDGLPNLHDKDAAQHLQGLWLVEIAELAAMRRSEVDEIKRFASARIDKFRPPYGRAVIESPRTAVFAATTNDDTYLKDTTGARRFWPVRCGVIDIAGLKRDRDQLFAEAVARYRQGERYWLDSTEQTVAAVETDERQEVDPWHDVIARHCQVLGDTPVTMEIIIRQVLSIQHERQNPIVTRRIKGILNLLGYVQVRKNIGRFYVKSSTTVHVTAPGMVSH